MLKPFRANLILFVFFLCTSFTGLYAQNDGIPARPDPPRLVNNLSAENPGFISASDVSALEAKLDEFNRSTSNQICVVIVDNLNGMEPNDFITKLGRKWQVGQKGFNNGIVLLIKPKQGNEKGKAYITAGTGLEGAIPDATCKNIIEHELLPRFREGKYAEGINASVDVLMGLAKGEFNKEQYDKRVGNQGNAPGMRRLLPVVIIIVLVFFFIMRRGGGGGGGGGFWIGGGGFGSGFGGGGGGGGGFGGFGGGSFGGGGAGGEW